jgi:hypothetical protein
MMSFELSILHSAVSIYQQGFEGHLEAHPQIPPNYKHCSLAGSMDMLRNQGIINFSV